MKFEVRWTEKFAAVVEAGSKEEAEAQVRDGFLGKAEVVEFEVTEVLYRGRK